MLFFIFLVHSRSLAVCCRLQYLQGLIIEITDDILAGDDPDKILLIINHRHKILVQCLINQVFHIGIRIHRTVVRSSVNSSNRYLLRFL